MAALRCARRPWIALCPIQPFFHFANVLGIQLASHLAERPARFFHLQRASREIDTDDAHSVSVLKRALHVDNSCGDQWLASAHALEMTCLRGHVKPVVVAPVHVAHGRCGELGR